MFSFRNKKKYQQFFDEQAVLFELCLPDHCEASSEIISNKLLSMSDTGVRCVLEGIMTLSILQHGCFQTYI